MSREITNVCLQNLHLSAVRLILQTEKGSRNGPEKKPARASSAFLARQPTRENKSFETCRFEHYEKRNAFFHLALRPLLWPPSVRNVARITPSSAFNSVKSTFQRHSVGFVVPSTIPTCPLGVRSHITSQN